MRAALRSGRASGFAHPARSPFDARERRYSGRLGSTAPILFGENAREPAEQAEQPSRIRSLGDSSGIGLTCRSINPALTSIRLLLLFLRNFSRWSGVHTEGTFQGNLVAAEGCDVTWARTYNGQILFASKSTK